MQALKVLVGRLTGKPPGGFQLGDKVSWGGCIGTVISTNSGVGGAPLQVLFVGPKLIVGFYADGRFLEWHKATDLKFLARQRRQNGPGLADPKRSSGIQLAVQPSIAGDHPDNPNGEAGPEGKELA